MKILLLVSLFKTNNGNMFGGAEKSIIQLGNWLAENTANDVYLVSVHGVEKPFEISPQIEYTGFEINKSNKIGLNLQIFKNIKHTINTVSPDVIITFEIYPLLYALLCTVFNKKIKLFYSERNDPKIHYSLLQRIIRDISLRFTDAMVCQTQQALLYFSKSIRRKSVVIHNPVYISKGKFSIPSECDNRIVAVGRLVKQKNYPLLIDAFNAISHCNKDLILEIYGEGPDHKDLQEKINRLGLTDKIILKGSKRNVIDLIYGARMFVMTSLYEGMPNALMEAMCLGIPVVCSNCPSGGPKELIVHGENGFLFENNNINDLIDKMKICLAADRIKLGEKEKEICITHSTINIFNQWYNFIISNI